MAIIATINSEGEISFIKKYDGRLSMIAEVFKDETLFSERIDDINKSKYREIIRTCKGEYNIIIHRKKFIPFPGFMSKVSDFLTVKEQAKFSKVSSEIFKEEKELLEDKKRKTLIVTLSWYDSGVDILPDRVKKAFTKRKFGVQEVGILKRTGQHIDVYVVLKKEEDVNKITGRALKRGGPYPPRTKATSDLHSLETYATKEDPDWFRKEALSRSVAISIPPKSRKAKKIIEQLEKKLRMKNKK